MFSFHLYDLTTMVALYSEPEEIAESLNSFFVESITSLNKNNVEECDHSKFLFHQDWTLELLIGSR